MTTRENRIKWSNALVALGLLLMIVAALLNLFIDKADWTRWAFAGGAVIVLVARVLGIYNGPALRLKRLHRILISSGILYCASALMMFIPEGGNNWIAFLLGGLVMQIYASWMIEHEEKKAEK